MLPLRGRGRVPALWVFTVKEAKPKDGENPPSEPVQVCRAKCTGDLQWDRSQCPLGGCSGSVSENRWWGVDVPRGRMAVLDP